MNELRYESVLGEYIHNFIELRQSVGYIYSTQPYVLRQFDWIALREMNAEGPVSKGVVDAYVNSLNHLKASTQRIRMSIVRQFLIYFRQFYSETFIPPRSQFSRGRRSRLPHIYTEDELAAILREALEYPHRYPDQRWDLWRTLIALLYVTGLRISEALALTLADVNLQQGLIHIRKTKFHKSRLVPLAPSSVAALKCYLAERAERGYSTVPSAAFFPSRTGEHLPYTTFRNAFRRILNRAGVVSGPDACAPRIHDLRHTAAVTCLTRWYKEDKDVQALLPVLVTYLGHTAIWCTEVYLTATTELLAQAGMRFEKHFPFEN